MSKMNYSVQINTKGSGNVKAYATVIVNDVLSIAGFKVVEGKNGLFVSHPQRKGTDANGAEKYYDDVKFVAEDKDDWKALTNELHKVILSAYDQATRPEGSKKPTSNTTTDRTSAVKARANVNDIPW